MNEHGVIDLASRRKVNPQHAVDLAPLAKPKKFDHIWTQTLMFMISPEVMDAHMEQRDRFAQFVADGGNLDHPPEELADLPVNSEGLILRVGPGCSKCLVHGDDPVNGWGSKCPISDDEFFAKHQQVQAQANNIRAGAFQQLTSTKTAAQ